MADAGGNLFTWSVDPQRQWYRCHHLFQSLLRNQLVQQYSPEAIAQLHTRASAWYASNGFVDEAIEHALMADNFTEAIRLVETHRHQIMNQERWPDLQRLLDRFPQQVIESRPELLILEAWVLHCRFRLAAIPSCLERLETAHGTDTAATGSGSLYARRNRHFEQPIVLLGGGPRTHFAKQHRGRWRGYQRKRSTYAESPRSTMPARFVYEAT